MNKSSTTNPLKRAALILLLTILSVGNILAQDIPWYGQGTEQSPYLITTTADFEALAEWVNNGNDHEGLFFRLDADLTYLENPFRGIFDGNNHTISGIRISSENDHLGLFGDCRNGMVKNLTLANTIISGSYYSVGGIAGEIRYGFTLTNCTVLRRY